MTAVTMAEVHVRLSSRCLTPPSVLFCAYRNVGISSSRAPYRANFFFGRGFNLEIFLNLQGSEFIQTLLLIYNHLAKFVVYKSWTRSALLKGTSKCFLVSSITCRNEEAIEWVWFEYILSFVVKLSTKPHPQTGSLH